MGMGEYLRKIGLLLLSENDIFKLVKEKVGEEIPIEEIHVLQYLLQSADNDNAFYIQLQDAFTTFIKEEVLLLPKINAVLIGNIEKRRLITEENFS